MWRKVHTVVLVGAVVAGATIIWIAYRPIANYWAVTHPSYRVVSTDEMTWPTNPNFQSCWADRSKRFRGAIVWPKTTARLGGQAHCEADGTYWPVNGDPLMVLSALVPRGRLHTGAPSMRLAITSLVEVSNDVDGPCAVLPEPYGLPAIECDLNGIQADWVRQNGVPQSLIDAMQQAARDAGWTPIDHSAPMTMPPDPIKVDPNPHFPK